MARGLILICAIGAVACGSILGLGDYEVGTDSPASPPAVVITPEGGVVLSGNIGISTSTLAFPDGKCGVKQTLPIIVTNQSNAAVTLAVIAPTGITVEGSAPNVPAGGKVTLTIGTDGVDHGSVTLTLGAQSFDIPFTAKFAGPRLGIDANIVDFGEIRHDTKSAPQTLDLENTGDEDVSVTGVAAGKDFALDAPVSVPAHGKATASFTMSAGPGGDPITASAALTTDKPLCDALAAIVFKGRRSPTDVTVSTTTVKTTCTNNPPPNMITVSNYGAQVVEIVANAQAPIAVGPSQVSLQAGTAEAPVTVMFNTVMTQPQQLGDFTYDLVITEGSLAPRTVTVTVHNTGAKLQYDASQINVDGGVTAIRAATNVGNVPVCIHYGIGGGSGGGDGTNPIVIVEPDEQFDPNVAGDIKVTGNPSSGGAHHQNTRVKPAAVPCSGATTAAPLCTALNEIQVDVIR